MKRFFNKYWFVFILLILLHLFLPTRVGAEGLTDVKIWNPAKVDWWVSMEDSVLSGKQACEIHWLYDDNLDVMLTMSDDNKLFFTFKVNPKNKDTKPTLTVKAGMAQKASLSIDNVKHSLGVTDVNLPPVTVIMGISSALNNIDYVQDANRLLLNLDNTIYNFPLENMDENIAYFRKCLQTLGHQTKSPASVKSEISAAVNEAEDYAGVPYDNAVTIEPLSGESLSLVEEEETSLPVEKNPIESAVEAKKLSKNIDNMLADTKYEGIKEKVNKSQDQDSQLACKGDVYDEQGTAIIHNLMRKLKILENEKEELRTKLIATSTSGTIPKILDCGTQSLEEVDQSINDDIVAKFEATINSLRSENELLKDALDEVEDTSEKDDDIAQLEKQLSDLVKQNHKLQDDLFNYELEVKSSDKEEEIPEQGSDIIDGLIKDNDLVDITPKNPETMSKDLPAISKDLETIVEESSENLIKDDDLVDIIPKDPETMIRDLPPVPQNLETPNKETLSVE